MYAVSLGRAWADSAALRCMIFWKVGFDMKQPQIFTAANILLPPYAPQAPEWEKWAVIACDQFTSESEYWASVRDTVGQMPSALRLILPEAYLGTPEEGMQRQEIARAMKELDGNWLHVYANSMIYMERTIPDGRVRRGLVGQIDLEAYDYQAGAEPAVRATEATVLERIPPRVAIRASAVLELPHVMLLMDDSDGLMDSLEQSRSDFSLLYDFPLMLGGGRAAGYRISGQALEALNARICAYEASRAGDLVYAVGDGNHSLAAAKAHYMNLRKQLGDAALAHPARYALVELTAIQDRALDFAPIYRIVSGCDTADFCEALSKISVPGESGAQSVRVMTEREDYAVSFSAPTHALTVGTLQDFIDSYIALHPGVKCDYIHDETSLHVLARRKETVGFLFNCMQKEELFPYVQNHGTLPRKTFSMGEARSKRYYIEARRIVQ